jgi:hypothetical protein
MPEDPLAPARGCLITLLVCAAFEVAALIWWYVR